MKRAYHNAYDYCSLLTDMLTKEMQCEKESIESVESLEATYKVIDKLKIKWTM